MTQAIAKKSNVLMTPVGDKNTLEDLIGGQSFQSAVKAILPSHVKPERMLKMVLVAASRQPTLYKCTQGSILQSLMKAAELGLDCSGTMGLAYLVPFYNSQINGYEAQFIVGYRGIIELAKRANKKLQIEARVVYQNDEFEFAYGLDQKLNHKPTMGARGDIAYFYSISREPGLLPEFTVMTREEVDAIKDRSKSRNRDGKLVGPWVTDYAEMGRKTVVKRHAKYLALSVEVLDAITMDDEQYRGHTLALASDVSQSVGLNAMKERMSLVPTEQQEPALPDPLPETPVVPEGEPQDTPNPDAPVVEPEPYSPDPGGGHPIPPDEDEAAEREAIEGEVVESVSGIDPKEEAALKLYDLRKNGVEVFRGLEKDDPEKYIAAVKWLGSKSITDLDEKKLNEFLKKFA